MTNCHVVCAADVYAEVHKSVLTGIPRFSAGSILGKLFKLEATLSSNFFIWEPKISLYFDPSLLQLDWGIFTTKKENFSDTYQDAKELMPHNQLLHGME